MELVEFVELVEGLLTAADIQLYSWHWCFSHNRREFAWVKNLERKTSFAASLAENKHERSVVLLELSIYSLITPSCTCLHALNRQECE